MRIGHVSSIDKVNGTVKVYFEDDDFVSKAISLHSLEQNLPAINEKVLCLFDSDGLGICLHGFFSAFNKPESPELYSYFKRLSKDSFIAIEENTGEMIISAPRLKILGNLHVEGDLKVTGSVTANEVIQL